MKVHYSLTARDQETGQLLYEVDIVDLNEIPEFVKTAEPEVAQFIEYKETRELDKPLPHLIEEFQTWQEL